MDKAHQSDRSEYQIRIDGKPVRYYSILSPSMIDEFQEFCHLNKDCYVDICRVSHTIIVNQGCYHAFKRHFKDKEQ